jgi:phage terminase large subunit-like protein
VAGSKSTVDQVREAAEADLETFIRLIAPNQVLGTVHLEWIRWTTRQDAKSHQLTLLPRDHQKSRLIAFWVAWEITKAPDIRVLYISATSNLAEKQLKFIKDILTGPIYRRYWPDMVHPKEDMREKWTNTEFSVDHPKRKEEGVRDPTVFTGGLTTTITGMHCDVAVLDDVVVKENAYTVDGRTKVREQYSLLASIEGTGARERVVGTRYFPTDLYDDLIKAQEEIFDAEGNLTGHEPIYEVFERKVEDRGDGTGTFLWPKQQRADGKWFGFDVKELARKRALYLDKSQYRAQYYNDPNDITDAPIDRSKFQYYDPKFLKRIDGKYVFQGRRLNVFASIDFAFSKSKRADWTALVVIGVDYDRNIYVLDIDRIKTDRISEYYELIVRQHVKWDFRRLRAETVAGQETIVKELKSVYLQKNGLALSIDEYKPNRNEGTKDERIYAVLEPLYNNQTIWHPMGGASQLLEEELSVRNPAHDDIKDALASACAIAVPPVASRDRGLRQEGNVFFHPRFGGMAL